MTLVSACAALAGITIPAAYREIIIAGPVIVLWKQKRAHRREPLV